MQTKRRNELLVGGFLVVGLCLFILLVFLMGSLDFLLVDQAIVEADFDDVQSLQVGDPVYVFGIKAGGVSSVNLLPYREGETATIRVAMVLPAEFRKRLRQRSRVRVDKTLTGNISVLIKEGEGPLLGEKERLRGEPTADLGAVTEKVNQVLSEGERLVSTISGMVEKIESEGTLTSGISDLAGIARDLRAEIGPVRDRLRQILSAIQEVVDENRLDVRHTVANLKETTTRVSGFTEKLADTPELVNRSLAEIEKAGEAVKNVLAENRAHIDTILEDLRETSTNAANLTAEVKRRPWRLLYRPSEDEERAMDLYDAAWAYNLGATQLNRSVRDLADQLQRIAREGYSAGALEEAQEGVRQGLLRYREAEDAFWERLRATE